MIECVYNSACIVSISLCLSEQAGGVVLADIHHQILYTTPMAILDR